MNFGFNMDDDMHPNIRKMIESMMRGMGAEHKHVEVLSHDDMRKLNVSMNVFVEKLPRLCFSNAALAVLYTGFSPLLPSLLMKDHADVIDYVGSPKWQYASFKDVWWRPGTKKKVLQKGDRICVCIHHLKGLTVQAYYVAALKKEIAGPLIRCEFGGGMTFPFREYGDYGDELPVESLFTLPNPFEPAKEVPSYLEGLEDMEAFADWEAPADENYFKG